MKNRFHQSIRLLFPVIVLLFFAVIISFTPLFRYNLWGNGFFTLRDVIENIIIPTFYTYFIFKIFIYLTNNHFLNNKKYLLMLLSMGLTLAAFGIGTRFAGNKISLYFCQSDDAITTGICKAAEIFHEPLGHSCTLLGNILILLSMLILQIKKPESVQIDRTNNSLIIIFGVLSGLPIFVTSVEGNIVIFSLPLLIFYFLLLFYLYFFRIKFTFRYPFLKYQFFAITVGISLIIIWGLLWNGFPEFSELDHSIIIK